MNFFGDYHTHTIYSRKPYIFYNHAKGSIEDNIIEAKNVGLKELAISDHGFSHKYFGCSRKNLKTTKDLAKLNTLRGLNYWLFTKY